MRTSILLLALAVTSLAALPAQGRNVDRLATFQPNDSFSDVWGWAQPGTGREFAFLLSRLGTYVVETTDPRLPVQKAYFSASRSGWSPSTWRDARTYRDRLYVVTEGGGGMQIIDMSNPDTPRFVRTYTAPGVSWGHSHNIAIDESRGLAFACGTAGGTLALDLSVDPDNPRYVGRYTREYVHDLQPQNGFLYLGEINRSRFRIVDIRNLPNMPDVGSFGVNLCHNVWPTRDDQFAVTSSEMLGGRVSIFDISDKSAPRVLGYWGSGNPLTSVHNVFVRDRVVHCSYYADGYQAFDLSDPADPRTVGYWDTSASATNFSGCWGIYPFQPSGVVYASDRQNGLVVLKPKAVSESYGVGTAGTGGSAPRLHPFGAAFLGNATFGLEVEGAPAGARVFFIVSALRDDRDVQGLRLLVDFAAAGLVETSVDASGAGRVTLAIPNDSRLNGGQLHVQCLVVDPAGPLGLAATAARTVELFTR